MASEPKDDTQKSMKNTTNGRSPLALTVNGKAEYVSGDEALREEIAENRDTMASIRRGLVQAKKRMGRPADDVLRELERETQKA